MTKPKLDIKKNNLKIALIQALTANDVAHLHRAAQEAINEGYQLAELNLHPVLFDSVCNALIDTGFKAEFKQSEVEK